MEDENYLKTVPDAGRQKRKDYTKILQACLERKVLRTKRRALGVITAIRLYKLSRYLLCGRYPEGTQSVLQSYACPMKIAMKVFVKLRV
jgi:hypothetical protein